MKDNIEKAVNKPSAYAKRKATSLQWFYNHIKAAHGDFKPNAFEVARKGAFIGGMFSYVYDPKHKLTLPVYDKFPIVIPIELYADGFLGLNLHYLPPLLRAKLLDKLMEYKAKSGAGVGEKHYMKMSYSMLKTVSKSKLFEPCLHRYLTDHIKSKVVRIHHEYWEEVAFLPTAQFAKQTQQEVWSNAR